MMAGWRCRRSCRRSSLRLIRHDASGARTLQRPRRLWLRRLHRRCSGGSRLSLPAAGRRGYPSSLEGPPSGPHLRTLLLGRRCCSSGCNLSGTLLHHALDISSKHISGTSSTCYAESLLPAEPLTALALSSLLRPAVLPEAIALLVIVGVEVNAQGTMDPV